MAQNIVHHWHLKVFQYFLHIYMFILFHCFKWIFFWCITNIIIITMCLIYSLFVIEIVNLIISIHHSKFHSRFTHQCQSLLNNSTTWYAQSFQGITCYDGCYNCYSHFKYWCYFLIVPCWHHYLLPPFAFENVYCCWMLRFGNLDLTCCTV